MATYAVQEKQALWQLDMLQGLNKPVNDLNRGCIRMTLSTQ
jgi:phosphotransacetylase